MSEYKRLIFFSTFRGVGLPKATIRDGSANSLSVARRAGDHGLSHTNTGLPRLNRRMPGREPGKPSFDLSDFSLGCIELGGCWCGLDVGTRVRAGASLGFGHGHAMVADTGCRQYGTGSKRPYLATRRPQSVGQQPVRALRHQCRAQNTRSCRLAPSYGRDPSADDRESGMTGLER